MIGIGPSFGDELIQGGVSPEGIAWGDDGEIAYREDVPQATRDAVAAVLASHNPYPGLRARLLEELAAAAERARERVLPGGAGKHNEYREKEREAKAAAVRASAADIADLEDAAAAQIAALPDDPGLQDSATAIIEAIAWP